MKSRKEKPKSHSSQIAAAVLLGILSGLFSCSACAWGAQGHRIICESAYRMLSPADQRPLNRMINEIPRHHQSLLNQFLKRPVNRAITFADSCSWADAIRTLNKYKRFASWHYVNTPRNEKVVDHRYCLNGCILNGINVHRKVLADSENPWTRLQALMFLGHWIGDIHQPLHTGFSSDRGGNTLNVKVGDETINLHWYWDTWVIRLGLNQRGINEEALIKRLLSQYSLTANQPESLQAKENNPIVWATESMLISRKQNVGYCIEMQSLCAKPDQNLIALKPNYPELHWPTVEERLGLAAQRLAAELRRYL